MSEVEVIHAYSDPRKSAPDVRVTVELRGNRIQTRWERVPKTGRVPRQIWLVGADAALYAAVVLRVASRRLRPIPRRKATWAVRLTRSRQPKGDFVLPGIEPSLIKLR